MSEKQQGIQSIDVGVRVLKVLAANPAPMGLKEIAAAAKTTPSNTHRYLVSLVQAQLVRQDEFSGRYALGAYCLQLGLIALSRVEADEVASRAMARLRGQTSKTVFLSLWSDRGPTIVRWQSGSAPLGVSVRLGQQTPLLSGTSGKVFLGFEPWDRVLPVLEQEITLRKTARLKSLTTLAEAKALRHEVREQGMSRVLGDSFPGIHGLSAPIFNAAGELAMALSVVDTEHDFDASFHGPLAAAVRDAAAAASADLGYRPPV